MGHEEDALNGVLERWQPALGLRSWRIRMQAAPEDWKRLADIKVDAQKKLALLLVNESVPPDELDEVIVHELVRLKLHAVERMLIGLMTSVYGSDEEDPRRILAQRQYQDQFEAAIQGITDAFLALDGAESSAPSASKKNEG